MTIDLSAFKKKNQWLEQRKGLALSCFEKWEKIYWRFWSFHKVGGWEFDLAVDHTFCQFTGIIKDPDYCKKTEKTYLLTFSKGGGRVSVINTFDPHNDRVGRSDQTLKPIGLHISFKNWQMIILHSSLLIKSRKILERSIGIVSTSKEIDRTSAPGRG